MKLQISLSGLSQVLYHITDVRAAESILRKNRFELKPSDGTEAETDVNGGKNLHYLSTYRSKISGYAVQKAGTSSAIFVIDGQRLQTKYAGTPVDYWQRKYVDDASRDRFEAEDRVLSPEKFIPNAERYIKSLHVSVPMLQFQSDPQRSRLYFDLRKRCLLRKIPLFWYNDTKDLLLMNRLKAVAFKPQLLAVPYEEPREYNFRKRKSVLAAWLALDAIPVRVDAKGYADSAWVATLSRDMDYIYGVLRHDDAISVLNAEMHCAKGVQYGDRTRAREDLDRLIELLRARHCTAKDFVINLRKKWYNR